MFGKTHWQWNGTAAAALTVALAGALVGSMVGADVVASPPAATAARPAGPAAPVALAQVQDTVARDLWAIGDMVALRQTIAQRLSKMNGMLHKRAYFERVPEGPQLASLERTLRRVATRNAIELVRLEALQGDPPPPCASRLRGDERWAPTMEQLFGRLDLRLHVKGSEVLIARFIDALPEQANRLVIVAGREAVDGEEMILLAEAWFERKCPTPTMEVRWPTLAERLVAGGWQANSPALVQALQSPEGKVLAAQIEAARSDAEKAAQVIQIGVDFPRWLARWKLITSRGEAAMAVRGRAILGLP